METSHHVARCIDAFCLDEFDLLRKDKGARPLHRATVYVSPKFTVKATRRSKLRKGDKQQEFVVTIGRPNWHERERVRQFEKVGEPFPVKKVALQYVPPKRKR